MKRLDRSKLEVLVPGLKPGWEQGALEPSCSDIDVGGLHAAYLKAARAKGVRIIANARVERAKWADRHWQIETRVGVVVAGVFVNAAGAWAYGGAHRAGASPLGIPPYRPTIVPLRLHPAPPDGSVMGKSVSATG